LNKGITKTKVKTKITKESTNPITSIIVGLFSNKEKVTPLNILSAIINIYL